MKFWRYLGVVPVPCQEGSNVRDKTCRFWDTVLLVIHCYSTAPGPPGGTRFCPTLPLTNELLPRFPLPSQKEITDILAAFSSFPFQYYRQMKFTLKCERGLVEFVLYYHFLNHHFCDSEVTSLLPGPLGSTSADTEWAGDSRGQQNQCSYTWQLAQGQGFTQGLTLPVIYHRPSKNSSTYTELFHSTRTCSVFSGHNHRRT